MMTRLNFTLQRWLAEPYQWGERDCCLALLDWVSGVKGAGLDLAADLRFTYDDFGSAQRAHQFFTDPLRIAVEYLERRAGLPRVAAPVRGDIGLFKWTGDGGRILPTGGICLVPGQFACRAEKGVLAATPDRVIAAWGVGYAGD